MKTSKWIAAMALSLLLLAGSTLGAINAGCVWEVRTTGVQTNGGGFVWTSLVSASYQWTASAHGTNEYYCQAAAGGDPSLTASGSVCTDGNYNIATEGTAGSLTAGQYDWADNDTLGYTTLYVRLANGLDPDTMGNRGKPEYVSYGAGGTDYSQQANAQMSATDICIVRGDTTQVYRSGATKWAQDYDNNILHLTVGGTVGWYHITSVDANDDAVLDRAAGVAGTTGITGAVGGAFLLGGSLDNDFFATNQKVAGNVVWVASGSYTLGESITGISGGGETTNPVRIIGYNASRGVLPLGTDRPAISNGAYTIGETNWTDYRNLQFTGTGSYVLSVAGSIFNCKITNTSTGGSKNALQVGSTATYSIATGCECATAGASGDGILVGGYGRITGCYIRDCAGKGIETNNSAGQTILVGCIIDSCGSGVDSTSYSGFFLVNCTVYNCTTGFITGSNYTTNAINCIFHTCTTAISVLGKGGTDRFVHNCFWNNTTNISTSTGDTEIGNIYGDPGLKDPAHDDFRIDASDTNVYEQGVDVGYFTTAITYNE